MPTVLVENPNLHVKFENLKISKLSGSGEGAIVVKNKGLIEFENCFFDCGFSTSRGLKAAGKGQFLFTGNQNSGIFYFFGEQGVFSFEGLISGGNADADLEASNFYAKKFYGNLGMNAKASEITINDSVLITKVYEMFSCKASWNNTKRTKGNDIRSFGTNFYIEDCLFDDVSASEVLRNEEGGTLHGKNNTFQNNPTTDIRTEKGANTILTGTTFDAETNDATGYVSIT